MSNSQHKISFYVCTAAAVLLYAVNANHGHDSARIECGGRMPRTSTVSEKEARKSKKNKRESKSDEVPGAAVARSSTVTLELHQASASVEDVDPLLLVSFPEGTVLDQIPLEYRRQKGKNSWKEQLVGETEKLAVVGTNYGRSHHELDSASWLVGVYDPSSDVMAVHPVAHVFPMRSTIKVIE